MKSVLVTGATGGMGKAICSLLNEKGYRVFGLDYNEGEDYGNVKLYRCDVTDMASVEAVYEKIKEETDELYAIVHTAGIYDLDSLIEMDEKRFTRIFEVNVFGVFRINKVFKPLLFTGSRIIITSSELGPLDPLPFTGIYGITKATLEKYAFSLRQETQLLDIPVSVIRPGAVKTGLLNASNALSFPGEFVIVTACRKTVVAHGHNSVILIYNARTNLCAGVLAPVRGKHRNPHKILIPR